MAGKQAQTSAQPTGLSFLKGQQGNVAEDQSMGYPGLLWYNGKPAFKKLGGVQAFGGFVVKAKQVGEGFPVGQSIDYSYADGTSEEVWDIGAVQIAVIADRCDWFFGSKAKPEWVSGYQVRGKEKPKARNRYLVLLRGAEGVMEKPFMITMYGVNGLLFHRVYQEFKNTVHAAGEKLAGQKLDVYTFWMHVAPGAFEKASKNYDSMINPPKLVLEMPGPGDTVIKWNEKDPSAFLEAAFIGEENMVRCAEWWEQAKQWREESLVNKSSGKDEDEDEDGDEVDLTKDDMPF